MKIQMIKSNDDECCETQVRYGRRHLQKQWKVKTNRLVILFMNAPWTPNYLLQKRAMICDLYLRFANKGKRKENHQGRSKDIEIFGKN